MTADERDRMLELLEQIAANNARLKLRLEAAERRLEQQSTQIERYLSEANTDELTGLPNRRAFQRHLDEHDGVNDAAAAGSALALLDLDHFKSINDQHGHLSGDQVLRTIADSLRAEFAHAIMVARLGGDEFAVLMSESLPTATSICDRFRERLAKQWVETGPGGPPITISIGLAARRSGEDSGSLVRRADVALYTAKHNGRNRVAYDGGDGALLLGASDDRAESAD